MTIDKVRVRNLQGSSWVSRHSDHFRAPDRFRGALVNWLNDRGFRCVYPVNSIYPADCRVMLGGGWLVVCSSYFRTHCSSSLRPDIRLKYLGFRCVYPLGDTNA